MKHELVMISWKDITSWNGWNSDIVEQGKDEPLEFKTVGFLLTKNRKKVVISDSIPDIGNLTVFPAGCVTNIEILKWKKA
jgi:hypothetical protein